MSVPPPAIPPCHSSSKAIQKLWASQVATPLGQLPLNCLTSEQGYSFLLSNSPLLGTTHLTWAISCPTGNYINTRGWKFWLLSSLIWVNPLFFEQGQDAYGILVPCSKNISGYHPLYVPKLWGDLWLDGILFFRDIVLKDLSVLNPPFFLCFHTFPPPQKKSNSMLTFSRENLAHAQCSVIHIQRWRFFD